MPTAAVVFGSVTPPQGDIVDLRVHLGCTNEVSSFECLLQNFDKKYGPSGTHPINVGDNGSISLGRGTNCPLILTLKVEEIEPLSTPNENYIRVKGRCSGEQLFRRLVSKSWDNVKGEVVVKYVIDNYTSLSHVRNSVELIEDTDTTYSHLEYEDTQAFDIIKYIAETADKAGVIGYDFRIAPDGKFEFFQRNSKTSSVSLSERLEISEYAKNIHRIKNKIRVYGIAERQEPVTFDSWTESLVNWSADAGTLYLDNLLPKWGTYSIRCEDTAPSAVLIQFKRIFDQVLKPQILRLWLEVAHTSIDNSDSWIRLLAPDESNYFQILWSDLPAAVPAAAWTLEEIALGRENTYDSQRNPSGKWIKTGSPSWANLQGIKFRLKITNSLLRAALWVDGLCFDKIRYNYTAEDSASQTQYGLREKVETDEELVSDKECEYRAKALLDFFKNPLETLKVRSEVVDYGTTPILAGDKIHVTIPNENIDTDYRVISVEYRASGRDQTLEVELELAKEPQILADFIYGFRKSIQKLDKYKTGTTTSATSGGGGGVGGGMIQHANEWHDPDMALQTDFASHKDRHKSGGADAFVLADLLDAVARVKVRKNSGASDIGSRRRLNFIEGSNVTLTVADDPADEEVDVTIASSGGAGGTPESILMGCMFKSLGGFDVYATAGTVTKFSHGVKVKNPLTGIYTGYAHYRYADVVAPAIFDKNPQFECYLQIDLITAPNDVYILIGGTAGYAPSTEKWFGIYISGNSLYIYSCNGTTASLSSALMTLAASIWYRIRCKLTSGTNIELWVDGVSKGTKTTNLPSGALAANHSYPQIMTAGDNATYITAWVTGLKVMHDY